MELKESKGLTYEQRLTLTAERMARRMGGQLDQNDLWNKLAAAPGKNVSNSDVFREVRA